MSEFCQYGLVVYSRTENNDYKLHLTFAPDLDTESLDAVTTAIIDSDIMNSLGRFATQAGNMALSGIVGDITILKNNEEVDRIFSNVERSTRYVVCSISSDVENKVFVTDDDLNYSFHELIKGIWHLPFNDQILDSTIIIPWIADEVKTEPEVTEQISTESTRADLLLRPSNDNEKNDEKNEAVTDGIPEEDSTGDNDKKISSRIIATIKNVFKPKDENDETEPAANK